MLLLVTVICRSAMMYFEKGVVPHGLRSQDGKLALICERLLMASRPPRLTRGLSALLVLGLSLTCGFLGAGLPSMKATVIAAVAVVLCAALVSAQFGGGGPGMTHPPCYLRLTMQRSPIFSIMQALVLLLALGLLTLAGLG